MFQFDNGNGNGYSTSTHLFSMFGSIIVYLNLWLNHAAISASLSLFLSSFQWRRIFFSRFSSVFMALQLFLDVISLLNIYFIANKKLIWIAGLADSCFFNSAAFLNCMANRLTAAAWFIEIGLVESRRAHFVKCIKSRRMNVLKMFRKIYFLYFGLCLPKKNVITYFSFSFSFDLLLKKKVRVTITEAKMFIDCSAQWSIFNTIYTKISFIFIVFAVQITV